MAVFTSRAGVRVKFGMSLSAGALLSIASGRPIGWRVDYRTRHITINVTLSCEDRLLALICADAAICAEFGFPLRPQASPAAARGARCRRRGRGA
jgi:hypothetical protein